MGRGSESEKLLPGIELTRVDGKRLKELDLPEWIEKMKYGKPAVTFEFACHWHLVHQRNAMAFA